MRSLFLSKKKGQTQTRRVGLHPPLRLCSLLPKPWNAPEKSAEINSHNLCICKTLFSRRLPTHNCLSVFAGVSKTRPCRVVLPLSPQHLCSLSLSLSRAELCCLRQRNSLLHKGLHHSSQRPHAARPVGFFAFVGVGEAKRLCDFPFQHFIYSASSGAASATATPPLLVVSA